MSEFDRLRVKRVAQAASRLEQLLADPAFHLEGREPDGELRDSMRTHGWIRSLPAIVDEDGNVLSGHRRMAVAEELGIEPVTTTLSEASRMHWLPKGSSLLKPGQPGG